MTRSVPTRPDGSPRCCGRTYPWWRPCWHSSGWCRSCHRRPAGPRAGRHSRRAVRRRWADCRRRAGRRPASRWMGPVDPAPAPRAVTRRTTRRARAGRAAPPAASRRAATVAPRSPATRTRPRASRSTATTAARRPAESAPTRSSSPSAVLEGPTAGEIFADLSGEQVEDSPESYENTLAGLGEYFSQHFQFYGRRIRFEIFARPGQRRHRAARRRSGGRARRRGHRPASGRVRRHQRHHHALRRRHRPPGDRRHRRAVPVAAVVRRAPAVCVELLPGRHDRRRGGRGVRRGAACRARRPLQYAGACAARASPASTASSRPRTPSTRSRSTGIVRRCRAARVRLPPRAFATSSRSTRCRTRRRTSSPR